jgi:hypothetical protein
MGSIPWHNDWLTVSCNVTLTGRGSLRWDSKVWFRVMSYSDYWVITLQIADPSSGRAPNRCKTANFRQQHSDRKWYLVTSPTRVLNTKTYWLTDWLTVSRKVTLTSTLTSTTETIPQISDSNLPTGSDIWSQIPHGYSIPKHTDRSIVKEPHLTSPPPRNMKNLTMDNYCWL